MVTHVITEHGKTAAVLDENDLSEAKSLVIKWLVGIFAAAMIAATSLGVYVADAKAKDLEQDRERAAILEQVKTNTTVGKQVDSIRIELRHVTSAVESIDRKLDRVLR